MHFDVRLQVTEKSELFAAEMTMMRFITYNASRNSSSTHSWTRHGHKLLSQHHRPNY